MEKVLEKVLLNGTEIYSLLVESDFHETQRILDINDYTQDIDAHNAYNVRVSNDFVGTYKVKIERKKDYREFIKRLDYFKKHPYRDMESKLNDVRNMFDKGLVTRIEAQTLVSKFRDSYYEGASCSCKICTFRKPTFEEWKTNKYKKDEKNIMKLGKMLGRIGIEQTLIDFYSLQVKTEKVVYLTISDLPQHVAGMSYYCELGAFDGMQGSSCQDTRHTDEEYPLRLGGSLHDNKLFVGMLHDSMDDLKDMEGKLIARTIFRYIVFEDVPCLIATTYYGNNETKDILHNVIEALKEVNIFSKDVRQYSPDANMKYHYESNNGYYHMTLTDDVHVCDTIQDDINIECPMCGGSGQYEVYSDRIENHINATCPACSGDGSYNIPIYIDIDEWVEVEDTRKISPYNEGYDFNGSDISIRINVNMLRDALIENGTRMI